MEKKSTLYDTPTYNPTNEWTLNNTPFKPLTIDCEYFSLMLIDDTVSDFTDCRVRDTGVGIEILKNDNSVVFYYHDYLKGYTFKVQSYHPHKID